MKGSAVPCLYNKESFTKKMENWGKVALLHPLRVYEHFQADITLKR